jgi:excinuclease ABC subunit C
MPDALAMAAQAVHCSMPLLNARSRCRLLGSAAPAMWASRCRIGHRAVSVRAGSPKALAAAPLYPCLMLDLDRALEFVPGLDAEFFATLPARPGVLLIEMREPGGQPYLVRTADVRRAAERLLSVPEELTNRLNLREVAARVRYRLTGSKFEQVVTHYQQARTHFPARYREVARIRPPAVLKVNLRSEYPRCYVTRRIRGDYGLYFGPFASRKAADAFGEAFLDLFKIRRCQIKIRRDPTFPGCIYSEMKMCLAPCFAGCTKQEYDAEVYRLLETLATRGAALIQEIERERETASEALDFEHAAASHKRLEKAAGVLRGLPDLTRKIDHLNLVILQRGTEEKTVIAFPVLGGILQAPVFLRFGELSSEPRSVESILRAGLEKKNVSPETSAAEFGVAANSPQEQIAAAPAPDERKERFGLRQAPPELSEHLCLIARWFYSNPRDGEVFFREADWPYRRILRACSRLLAQPSASDSPIPKLSPEQKAKFTRDRIKRLKTFSKPRHKPAK